MLATLLFLWRRHRRRPVNGLDGSYEADDVSVESSALESDAQMPFQGVVEMLMAQAPPLLSPRAVPGGLNSCPWTFVELPEQLEVLAEQLGQLQRFALDVEHHGTHSYFGATCLLQISTGERVRVGAGWVGRPICRAPLLLFSYCLLDSGALQSTWPRFHLKRSNFAMCDRAGRFESCARFATCILTFL